MVPRVLRGGARRIPGASRVERHRLPAAHTCPTAPSPAVNQAELEDVARRQSLLAEEASSFFLTPRQIKHKLSRLQYSGDSHNPANPTTKKADAPHIAKRPLNHPIKSPLQSASFPAAAMPVPASAPPEAPLRLPGLALRPRSPVVRAAPSSRLRSTRAQGAPSPYTGPP